MLQDEGRTSLHLRAAVTLALCFLLLLFCSVAQAKVDVEVKNSRGKFSIDSDAASVATASYRCEIKTSVGEADLTLVPDFSYRSADGAEVNLEHSYARLPLGIWSIYGGTKTIATSFYYQKFGQGFFAGIAYDKNNDSEILYGMREARTVTTGMVWSKRGRNKDTEIKLSYSNAYDEIIKKRYENWSLESEKTLNQGHKLSYSISHYNRTFWDQQKINYSAIAIGYEHKVREGFTTKLSLDLSHSRSDAGDFRSFRPFWKFKLTMLL